jgi:hypothetical protein
MQKRRACGLELLKSFEVKAVLLKGGPFTFEIQVNQLLN